MRGARELRLLFVKNSRASYYAPTDFYDRKRKDTQKIDRIAETHFYLRPVMISGLKSQILTEEGKKRLGGVDNYYEAWEKSFNDKFFDMGTFIRLGTELENGLKYYYMEKKGYKNLIELKTDPRYEKGIFQRVLPWTQHGAIDLFKNELEYDLNINSMFSNIQEIMLCRHLYAHNAGLLDDNFIANFKTLTNIDVLQLPDINSMYPENDTYYFGPLEKLNNFIENSRNFIKELP